MAAAKLTRLFEDYAAHHQHPVNRAIHKIAIPLIVFQIVATLGWVHLGPHLTLAHLVYAAAVAWYLYMDLRLGMLLAALIAVCFPIARVVPWPVVIAIGVVAWSGQFLGHAVFEKRQPAFFHNLTHALVGPAFFVARALHMGEARA
jgi:uncharacterized membrane protein YGL010W